ncbi:Autoinducer 2 sensor kinase/phosphatase LuxQ [Thalassocella blandensis]|nr:Autoinducer 2 sensor kinase/phosphatase LuxQ [Thalassocella blandensis]
MTLKALSFSQKTVKGYRWRYCIALLLIAFLATTSFVLIEKILKVQYEDAATVNIAGRQRMLSQKIAFYARMHLDQLRGAAGTNSSVAMPSVTVASELKQAAKLFLESHVKLTSQLQYHARPEALNVLYYEGNPSLDMRVREYSDAAQQLSAISADNVTALSSIKSNLFSVDFIAGLLRNLDDIVSQYEVEARQRSEALSRIELFVWLFALTILSVEALVIFRPLEKMLSTSFRSLEEQKLEAVELQKKAEMAADAKGHFLANMSHEIRTPMNGVLGMLSLLQNSKLDEEQSRRLDIAMNSAQSLLSLINDILDFSKIDANKIRLEYVDFDLRRLFDQTAESLAMQAHEKNLELVVDLVGVPNVAVNGDPVRLRQIVVNLAGNALKFTTEGHVIIKAKLSEQEKESLLTVSVQDSGIGIPQEKIPELFNLFSQVDESTTRKYGGTGLGLAIVKKLCDAMGGDIEVSSEVGVGSEFNFTVRLQRAKKILPSTPNFNLKTLNVLVVDDNHINREVLCSQLNFWGVQTRDAASAAEALTICEKEYQQNTSLPFDMAILDMQMPQENGLELGEKLKADYRFSQMKLVMMTSMNQTGDIDRFAKAGFSAYFPKPITSANLNAVLRIVAEDGQYLQDAQPILLENHLGSHRESSATHDRVSARRGRASQSFDPSFEDNLNTGVQAQSEHTFLLIVDDNDLNLEVARGILEDEGFAIETAKNGEEAIAMLTQNKHYAAVLMDCQMPTMDGFTATRNIRGGAAGDAQIKIPIIAMTANVMPSDREKCFQSGMDDYISKPIDPDLLLETIEKWTAQH